MMQFRVQTSLFNLLKGHVLDEAKVQAIRHQQKSNSRDIPLGPAQELKRTWK